MTPEEFQSASRRKEIAKENSKTMEEQGNLMGSLLPIFVGVVIIACIVVVAIALLRTLFASLWVSIKTMWLYPAVVVAALVAYILIRRILKKYHALSVFVGFLSAAAIGFFGWQGVTAHYSNTIIRPSVYSADFIQALPDGKTPSLYEKANAKGKIAAELTAGEKVIVNGLSINKKAYNITTVNGATGWVELAAFPADAAKTISIAVGIDGLERGGMALDRQVPMLAERYLEKTKGHKDKYGFSQKNVQASVAVNTRTPLLYVTQKAYKKGKDLIDEGVKVHFSNIVYAPDCTIIYLSVTDTYDSKRANSSSWVLTGGMNTNDWKNSLTVTDLDNGTKWNVLPANYYYLTHNTAALDKNGEKNISSVVFFFPPFKSRHFSLTHTVQALPGQNKAGYGGFLGGLASFAGSWTGNRNINAYFIDYNFQEVRIK